MTPAESLAYLTEKQTAYRIAFSTTEGKAVLDDLMPFCRARETCVVPGDRDRTYVLEGRREVYLRIRDYIERTPEELVALFTTPLEGDKAHVHRTKSQPES